VGGGHTEFPTTGSHTQPGRDGHLVALHPPHFQDPRIVSLQLQFVPLVEDGTAIGSIVLLDVQARGIRFREEDACVVLATQHGLQKLEVVYLLIEYITFKCDCLENVGWADVNILADKSHRAGSAESPGQSGTCGAPR